MRHNDWGRGIALTGTNRKPLTRAMIGDVVDAPAPSEPVPYVVSAGTKAEIDRALLRDDAASFGKLLAESITRRIIGETETTPAGPAAPQLAPVAGHIHDDGSIEAAAVQRGSDGEAR